MRSVARRRGWVLRGLLAGSPFLLVASLCAAGPLDAGTRRVTLHARDGASVEIGQVSFSSPRADGRIGFALKLDPARFTDHFLSMREFKCLTGGSEVLCHVPYPYANPAHVAADDLAWLEHALLFMFKKPAEFGAKLGNGVYWQLRPSDKGLVGAPQAVDLNLIAAPPARADVAPLRPALRDDFAAGTRSFDRLTIE